MIIDLENNNKRDLGKNRKEIYVNSNKNANNNFDGIYFRC